VACTEGIVDYGLRVGLDTEVSEVGAFGRALLAAATLRSALETFLRDVNTHSSCAAFGLRPQGDSIWLWRLGIPGLPCDPVEQYVLGLMLRILRLAGGPGWVPERIQLQARELPGDLAAELFAETRIDTGAPLTAVRFPAALLASPSDPS
jgi:hypothetical protein